MPSLTHGHLPCLGPARGHLKPPQKGTPDAQQKGLELLQALREAGGDQGPSWQTRPFAGHFTICAFFKTGSSHVGQGGLTSLWSAHLSLLSAGLPGPCLATICAACNHSLGCCLLAVCQQIGLSSSESPCFLCRGRPLGSSGIYMGADYQKVQKNP